MQFRIFLCTCSVPRVFAFLMLVANENTVETNDEELEHYQMIMMMMMMMMVMMK